MKRIAFMTAVVLTVFALTFWATGKCRGDELTDAVNYARAQHGLHSLAHDENLSAWAAENNRYGFGHHVLGPARRQNAAWGIYSVAGVVDAWLRSPGHRAALLASDITHCGGAYNGSCWTWNAATYSVMSYQQPVAPPKVTPTPQHPTPQTPPVCVPGGCTPELTRGCLRGFHPFKRLFGRCR